ncbi:septum site-determining protein MinC [Candidatus Erwinia haradaeae]|uniref:Probable septum site-determining protein MinC n=1 Tax=Candidatus Erwinia haradaeae TaxID=1922217 RepID=A0A451D2C9_9GAMM|nr:septum site-determining protein MinC [Candidatus Erwinia haradaeae]VFP79789.1 Septum site-determining protein MinC [Candidatus Erwinia haradaeae]
MSQLSIALKGSNFTLPVLHLHNSDPVIVRTALEEKFSRTPNFFNHAAVIVNVEVLTSEVDWNQMQKAILSTGIFIVGISGCKDEQLKNIIIRSGLPVLNTGQFQTSTTNNLVPVMVSSQMTQYKTRMIFSPVRSGQQIYAKNTDLVIINNVSEGAELVADGNIHVYGIMRGRALAGANGDYNCQIFCTNLLAELVSISGHYWMMDQIPSYFASKAARIYLKNEALTIQKLN